MGRGKGRSEERLFNNRESLGSCGESKTAWAQIIGVRFMAEEQIQEKKEFSGKMGYVRGCRC